MPCNNYWSSVLQNAIGCTLGSFLAIWAAYKIYRSSNKDHQKEIEELARIEQKESLKYFSELIGQVLRSSKQQNDEIKKFATDTRVTPLYLPLLSFVPLFDFKRVAESHALDRLFFAYTKQFKEEHVVKNFREIISSVEFLYTQFLELPAHAKRGMTFDHERKVQFRQLHSDAYSLIGQYMGGINNHQLNQIDQAFMQIIDDYNANFTDPSDLKFYYDYLFVPVNNLTVQILVNGNRTTFFIQLAELIRNGKQVYLSISKHNEHLADEFDDIHNATAKVINGLEQVSSKLIEWGRQHD